MPFRIKALHKLYLTLFIFKINSHQKWDFNANTIQSPSVNNAELDLLDLF